MTHKHSLFILRVRETKIVKIEKRGEMRIMRIRSYQRERERERFVICVIVWFWVRLIYDQGVQKYF